MRTQRIFLIAAFLFLVSSGACAQPPEVTATDILAQSAQTYAKLSRYVGTSIVVNRVVVQVNETRTMEATSFATARIDFVRGGTLKIEGIGTYGDKYSIVSDGEKATSTRVLNGDEKAEELSIERAVGSLGGITAGAATVVPAALLNMRLGLNRLTTAHAPQLQGREKIGLADCYKIVDADPVTGVKSTFWIDGDTFLMHQYRTVQDEIDLEGADQLPSQVRKSLEETQKFMAKAGIKSISALHTLAVEEVN